MSKNLKQPKQRKEKSRSIIDLLGGTLLHDNLLVVPIIIENDAGLARPQQYEDKPDFGKVLMVGTGRVFDTGTVQPLKVKVGDIVLFQKYSAQKIRHEGQDYMILHEEDIYWHD